MLARLKSVRQADGSETQALFSAKGTLGFACKAIDRLDKAYVHYQG